MNAHDRGWWTFTLPGKYLDRVHGYINYNEKGKLRTRESELDTGIAADQGTDDEDVRSMRSTRSVRSWISRASRRSRTGDVEKREYHNKMRNHMSLRLPTAPKVFSMNQTTVSSLVPELTPETTGPDTSTP